MGQNFCGQERSTGQHIRKFGTKGRPGQRWKHRENWGKLIEWHEFQNKLNGVAPLITYPPTLKKKKKSDM